LRFEIFKTLEENKIKPGVVTFENRLLGCALLFFPAIFVLGQMIYLSRLGSFVAMYDLNNKMLTPVVVDWLLEGENLVNSREAYSLARLPSRDALAQWQSENTKRQQSLIDLYKARIDSLTLNDIFLVNRLMLSDDPQKQLGKVIVQRISDSNRLVALHWPIDNQTTEIDSSIWQEIVEQTTGDEEIHSISSRGIFIMLYTLFPFAVWLFISALTGANLSLRFSGQAVVWSDGHPVSIYIR